MAIPRKRFGRRDGLLSFLGPASLYLLSASLLLYTMWPQIYYLKNEVLITLGVFSLWRYGWLLLNFTRAFIYGKFTYPRLKQKILKLSNTNRYPKHVYFAIPSYKEEAWVSIETFKSILNELSRIPSKATIIVATSGDPQEDALIYETCKNHFAFEKIELVFQHQQEGKRIAMGHAMRAIARRYSKVNEDYNSVTFFMDGDSYLEKGFFEKLLPHFIIDKQLGAVTTNEAAFIRTNSNWYKDWFNLKFGQRHVLFQSHSLSKKVLTLTGRLSAYRTDIIVREDFIKHTENDVITTVMNGKFRFLMGDDKSTWFYLLKDGWNMRYLPDTLCYSLESRDANFLSLSRSLPYRWYGNTLRNSNRALALGPKKMKSFFIWWAVLDQRISMWTSLIGVTGALLLGIFKSPYYLLFFIVWVFYIRVFQMFVIAFNGHLVSWRTIPLMVYSQWFGSFVKIKALFHLSDQKWSKGNEEQKSDKTIAKINHPLFQFMPDYLMTLSYAFFFYIMLLSHDVLAFPDADVLKQSKQNTQHQNIIYAKNFGVIANDNKDDAPALNRLIATAAKESVIILPKGVIDLYHTVLIQRSNITIQGISQEETHLVSHLHSLNTAALYIKGERTKKIGYLQRNIKYGESVLDTKLFTKNRPKWIKVRQPNDTEFFDAIGSQKWRKKYPYLRQEITCVETRYKSLLYLKNALTTPMDAKKSEIYGLKMIENIQLKDFSIQQNIPQHSIQETIGKYENLFPNYRVDMIRFEYSANSRVSHVTILNSGRHPLVFENVFACTGQNLIINGAWNKGKQGSGYIRFSRAFSCLLENSSVQNIRHITLQWSSANNVLRNLHLGVDINLHGGYSHDNFIEDITFALPAYHHWKAITLTPPNAHWAPPDGDRNIVHNIFE